MDLKQLLNPLRSDNRHHRDSGSPPHNYCPSVTTATSRRQRLPKDAPIFAEGNRTVGIVNYPPFEAGDDRDLLSHHHDFKVYPLGEIRTKGVRHIPYNSDKKDFLNKTGRNAFEVFQYTFKRPCEDKEYTVVWDYNVGLVRMTPFFKSCKYTKTIPAKALRENAGLKNISYSITGGALVCQGYWMPYDAAKAVAATFCHDIRWALTPVFGNDFPSLCLLPNHVSFANFKIDPRIVRHCALETDRFRTAGPSYRLSPLNMSSPVNASSSQIDSPSVNVRVPRQCRLQPADMESGYGTDTESSYRYLMSPAVSPRTQPISPHRRFTPVNGRLSPSSLHTPCSPSSVLPIPHPATEALLPANVALAPTNGFASESFRTKRNHSKVALIDRSEDNNTSLHSPVGPVRYDSGQESDDPAGNPVHTRQDMDAAAMLLSLSAGETCPPTKRTRRGSKY